MATATAPFPHNKRFAFTIFDDADFASPENIGPVYRFLTGLGIRTTNSVWPLPAVAEGRIGGSSLHKRAYLDLILRLQSEGTEIGLHGVRNHHAPRELIEQGFARFRELLGQYPRVHANHSLNRENIYWGDARLNTASIRLAYNLATRFKRRQYFQGHIPTSPYFWGDICQQHISYVRNFIYDEINLARLNPTMPYHDPTRPYVNHWFSASNGHDVNTFCALVSEANQDRLEEERGICIVYTHFAQGFCHNGTLDHRFESLMRRLARKNGWFVPVSELLDHLRSSRQSTIISKQEATMLERHWWLQTMRAAPRSLSRLRLAAAPQYVRD